MQVQIKEIQPFSIVGVASRHSLPNVKRSADIPAFWNKIALDYGKHLTRLYDTFTPVNHGEYALGFDIDEKNGEFTYMLGVAFDSHADEKKIEQDMQKVDIIGGLYAVFTTPKVSGDQYPQSIADTWREILTQWLPEAEYEYDSERLDFEAYDERDHEELNGNMVQMDICIPIKGRKKEGD